MSNTEQKLEQRQKVREIMAETEERLSAEIGSPVSLIYHIKVNRINPQIIIQYVLDVCGITYAELIRQSKEKKNVVPRHLIVWLCKYFTDCSDQKLGDFIHRDRTTVCKAIQHVNDMLDTDDQLYTVPLKIIEEKIKTLLNGRKD